jgi:membrane protease YdiL (CAAX protease family)
VYALPVYALAWLAGLGVFPNPDRIARLAERYSSSNVAATVTIFVLFSMTIGMLENLISGLFEEIGWRGLLVPELAKVTSFTKTAVISGIVWAAWHMPGIFLAGLSGDTPAGYAAAWFAVMIVALSFPMAWLTLKSGSLWPAALLHASHNLFVLGIFDQLTGKSRLTPFVTGEYGIGLALTLLVVAYVVWRRQQDVSLRTQPFTMRSRVNSKPINRAGGRTPYRQCYDDQADGKQLSSAQPRNQPVGGNSERALARK